MNWIRSAIAGDSDDEKGSSRAGASYGKATSSGNDGKSDNVDSLLRFFQSDFFNENMYYLMYYLKDSRPGIEDYLVNKLYQKNDIEIDFYLPQFIQLCLTRMSEAKEKGGSAHRRSQSEPNKMGGGLNVSDGATSTPLFKFLVYKAGQAVYFALKTHWILLSILEEKEPCKGFHEAAERLVDETERSVVLNAKINSTELHGNNNSNGLLQHPVAAAATSNAVNVLNQAMGQQATQKATQTTETDVSSPPKGPNPAGRTSTDSVTSVTSPDGFETGQKSLHTPNSRTRKNCQIARNMLKEAVGQMSHADRGQSFQLGPGAPNCYDPLYLGDSIPVIEGMQKIIALAYWNAQTNFSTYLFAMTNALVTVEDRDARVSYLRRPLNLLNVWLFERRCFGAVLRGVIDSTTLGLTMPFHGWSTRLQLLKVHTGECKVFSTRNRAPYLLLCEFADVEDDYSAYDDGEQVQASSIDLVHEELCHFLKREYPTVETFEETLRNLTPEDWKNGFYEEKRMSVVNNQGVVDAEDNYHFEEYRPDEGLYNPIHVTPGQGAPMDDETVQEDDGEWKDDVPERVKRARDARLNIWGESSQIKKERIRHTSPYSVLPSWRLQTIVVKSGDDVRQEVLAAQLISQYQAIWAAAGLPLKLLPTEVLITGAESGFIEFVPDSCSVDRIKQKYPKQTLKEIFDLAFGDRMYSAKQNYIQSLAAYSLYTYLLQIKDRHNGNILFDRDGYLIHIDFGFMLSNSPGKNMNFEAAPFKLTQEYIDVMDGQGSAQYHYFCTLFIKGFLELRRHTEEIITTVQMQMVNSYLPCFSGAPHDTIIKSLQSRFLPGMPDDKCVVEVQKLIDESANNWRTNQYDAFQKWSNGIL